jgi:hypothetical protein
MTNYLIDAGPLIGLLNKSDQWHPWSAQTLAVLDEPLATTEAALTEACHRLQKLRPALQIIMLMVAEGRLVIKPQLPDHVVRIAELLDRDSAMDLADATLVTLSEQNPKAKLITLDRRDFSRYRRSDGSLVPSLMPPA